VSSGGATDPFPETDCVDLIAVATPTAEACRYEIPERRAGLEIRLDLINISLVNSEGERRLLPIHQSGAACEQGWQFSADDGRVFVLCRDTCEMASAAGIVVEVNFGCRGRLR
jgi:hypothetical protein